MLRCKKCRGRVFVDRTFNADNHIEIFCIVCGSRKFYHNFSEGDKEAQWLMKMEKARAKLSISQW
jgi:predicted  nucleic acid-binding Zn-ribbon protein